MPAGEQNNKKKNKDREDIIWTLNMKWTFKPDLLDPVAGIHLCVCKVVDLGIDLIIVLVLHEDKGFRAHSWQPQTCHWFPSVIYLMVFLYLCRGILFLIINRRTTMESSQASVCYYNKGFLQIFIYPDFFFYYLFPSGNRPPSLLRRCARPAPPQVLWRGGVWRGTGPGAPRPSPLHPPVPVTDDCSPSHTAQHTWVIPASPTFPRAYNEWRCGIGPNECVFVFGCVQPPARKRSAVRVTNSATAR